MILILKAILKRAPAVIGYFKNRGLKGLTHQVIQNAISFGSVCRGVVDGHRGVALSANLVLFAAVSIYVSPGAALMVLIVAAAITDARTHKILNVHTLPAIVAGLASRLLLEGAEGFWLGLAGFGVGFGLMLVLFLLGGMGAGDVKLMGAVGVFLGAPATFHAFVYASLAGVVYSLTLLLIKGRFVQAFLNIGENFKALVVPGLKPAGIPKERAIYVPYGIAIAVGTLVAFVQSSDGQNLLIAAARLIEGGA